MLRKLISAVFVLGFILTLNGTAFSDVPRGSELNKVEKVYPNLMDPDQVIDVRPAPQPYRDPGSELIKLPTGLMRPVPPQTYFCDVEDYTSGNVVWVWTMPSASGRDLMNMRFNSVANYNCTLKVAWVLLYAGFQYGSPDLWVYLYDDDMFGFPGNKLDSVFISQPGDALEGMDVLYWVGADFSAGNWVFSDGDAYHYAVHATGTPGSDGMYLASDDADGPYAGEERASAYIGAWGTMNDFYAFDPSFYILSERCCSEIPYSDCTFFSYWQNVAVGLSIPHPTSNRLGLAVRFDAGPGTDTVQYVEYYVYDFGDGHFGDNTVYVTLMGDDGSGLPDNSNIIATASVLPGGYAAFPAVNTVIFNQPVSADVHVALSTDGDTVLNTREYFVGSDGTDGVARSSVRNYTGAWQTSLSFFGADRNVLCDAYICKDEFSDCDWNACYTGLAYFYRLPDVYGDYAQAQYFPAVGEECRVQDVNIMFYWGYTECAKPLYSHDAYVKIWSDAGGLPGAEQSSITITPADFAAAGLTAPSCVGPSKFVWMSVDFEPLNVLVTGGYWVGVEEPLAVTADSGIRTLSDGGGGGCDDRYAENYLGTWEILWPYWGGRVQDEAMVLEALHCCIPFSGRDCLSPGESWPTYMHDAQRTGASQNALGDAWADLTVDWNYNHPTMSVQFCGPVIAFGKVVQAFNSGAAGAGEYKVFNLATGALLATLTAPAAPAYAALRCTPAAGVVGPDTLLFVSGGNSRWTVAYNFNTYAVKWQRLDTPYGNNRFGRYILAYNATLGYDILAWGTEIGRIVAVNASTGVIVPGYPLNVTIPTWVSGSTDDGTNLFYGTAQVALLGDLYRIDAATATITHTLSGAGGLQGGTIWDTTFSEEGFRGGIAIDGGTLYTNSFGLGDYPVDGIFYSLNTADLTQNFAIMANRVQYTTPIIDVNHVYMPSLTRWVTAPAGGNLYAVNKGTGAIDRTFTSQAGGRYNGADGVLTCEPEPDPDLLYVLDEVGFLSCVNSVTFDEIYNRRLNNPAASVMGGGAMGPDMDGDMHLVFGACNAAPGQLVSMKKATMKAPGDRARLEIQTYNIVTPVEFGPAASLIVTVPNVFTNTGATDLVFSAVTADQTSFGPGIPDFASAVDKDFMQKADKIADAMAREAYLSKYQRPVEGEFGEDNIMSGRELDLNKERTNRAAAAFPPFLNSVVQPAASDVIAAGGSDTMDLILDVIQSAINRGPQNFYVKLETNDPDFFLNDTTLDPQIRVSIVGGCLVDTTTLFFGAGGANMEWVSNTARLATGDWTPHGWEIDGDGASYYQGSYVYGVDSFSIATHSQDWTSGGGENDAIISAQPDPNWCDDACKPYLSASVSLGMSTPDGITYNALSGDMICKSFLDSVQNFDLGAGWAWDNWGAPFDNALTMGLYVNGRVVGVLDPPAEVASLGNVTLEILEFTERNGGTVDNMFLGEFYDCDNGGDTALANFANSVAWSTGGDQAWGQIKVPFGGCAGYPSLINTWGTFGASGTPGHGFWGWGIFWDSCYNWMNSPQGIYSDGAMSAGDAEALVTLAGKDFGPNDTMSLGIAHFALFGLTDPRDTSNADITALAQLVNKWAGFGRGDVNGDDAINLVDIVYLAAYLNNGGPGPMPFLHLGDVDADTDIDMNDVEYLKDFYFGCGPCPIGDWIF
ncbi:MAG TPA: dockerin type I domain-containing protein [Candidatus Deferrimicrobium sp.]|nr:dockerin type I domain-containing protein [Candidatus Deferrimicrobium sp.]